jgi:hypothetical protein
MRKKKQGHEITVVPCRPFLVLLQSHIQIAWLSHCAAVSRFMLCCLYHLPPFTKACHFQHQHNMQYAVLAINLLSLENLECYGSNFGYYSLRLFFIDAG